MCVVETLEVSSISPLEVLGKFLDSSTQVLPSFPDFSEQPILTIQWFGQVLELLWSYSMLGHGEHEFTQGILFSL